MRGLLGIAAALALLLGATEAAAAEWQRVSTDNDQTIYEVDDSSIRQSGGFVIAWARFTFHSDRWDAVARKWYRTGSTQRLDNCVDHAFAITAVYGLDSKGAVVSTIQVPQAQWRFNAVPPGSAGEAVHQRICSIAAHRATLHASVPVGPTTEGGWRVASFDPVNQIDYLIDMDHVFQASPDVVLFYTRQVAHRPSVLPTGETVQTTMVTTTVNCRLKQIAELAIDYYDTANNLVASAGALQHPEPMDLRPGSNGDNQRTFACRPGVAKPLPQSETATAQPGGQGGPADTGPAGGQTSPAEGQVSVGTGWLAPKGYVVTALHVVGDAAQVMLAQNGNPVGSAEVVVADPANDVAILRPKFNDGPHVAIPLRLGPAPLGLKVFTLGYPAPEQMGLSIKMTSGEVSALAGLDVASSRQDDARLMQVSIPVHSGNSGGPVIDATGHAAGIVISKLEQTSDTEVAQNVSYAIKIGYVRNLLADLPDLGGWRAARPATTTVGQVSELQGGVFLIIARPADEPTAADQAAK
jgi:S1-C subfamily serine protease